jgi:uncharacterized protein YjbI with pentapeptide repeats
MPALALRLVGGLCMADTSLAAFNGEQPVNPYSLLEAVNDGSDTVNTAWLIFLAIMSYLLISVAGVSHKDLLLSSDISLPILQVKIALTSFFLFAPILLLLFHLGVVSQLVMLARKTIEFDSSLQLLEATEKRTHPLRLELHNFFFVQAIAGPERSPLISGLLHGMSWLTVIILPLVLLLYVQVAFLPYHDTVITGIHRSVVLADIVILVLVGTFMTRTEISFKLALSRAVRQHPITTGLTSIVLVLVLAFSVFVATIPGETLDRISDVFTGRERTNENASQVEPRVGYALPFVKASTDGSLFGLFYRNLNVTDLDLVVDKDVVTGDATLNLRGRDLRFANLSRSDLHQADLTGANLDGASLVGTDLRSVIMQCGDINALLLLGDRSAARCPTARSADFSRSRMTDAKLSGIDLTGSKFEDARLENADLSFARMAGANFASAHLGGADLTGGVELQGASFLVATLPGADFTGAKLTGANFASANLQGTVLNHAHLEGAVFRDTDLDSADLQLTWLQGADFSGARIAAADFRGSAAWRTLPPLPDTSGLVDFSQLSLRPLDLSDIESLKRSIQSIDSPDLKARLLDATKSALGPEENGPWTSSVDFQKWRNSIAASESQTRPDTRPETRPDVYRARLTDWVAKLMCRPRSTSGAIATGIIKRSRATNARIEISTVMEKLRGSDCAASSTVSPRTLRELLEFVDASRSN